jgi:hypothetical protein
MIWQRVCLAIFLSVGGAYWSHAAAAQTNDSAAEKVDHSAPAPTHASGPKVIVRVDLTAQRMHVTFPDGTEETWPIASGRPGLDTPEGKYKAQWVDPDHMSKQYQDAPMPYAVFFDLKGHAFHGSYQKKFGAAVSHGCVRLPVNDAKKLYEAVKIAGAEIEITGKARRGPGQLQAQAQDDAQHSNDRQVGFSRRASAEPAPPANRSPLGALFGFIGGGPF